MGSFAEVLHIRPWETRLLTVDEFDKLEQYLVDREEAMRKAAKPNG
jgi:hypothetical protein